MSNQTSRSTGSGVGRAVRLAAAAAAALALGAGLALPATAGAQDDDEFASVAECFAADEGLGTCIDLFIEGAPTPPTFDDGDDENGAGFDTANLLPNFFGDDED